MPVVFLLGPGITRMWQFWVLSCLYAFIEGGIIFYFVTELVPYDDAKAQYKEYKLSRKGLPSRRDRMLLLGGIGVVSEALRSSVGSSLPLWLSSLLEWSVILIIVVILIELVLYMFGKGGVFRSGPSGQSR